MKVFFQFSVNFQYIFEYLLLSQTINQGNLFALFLFMIALKFSSVRVLSHLVLDRMCGAWKKYTQVKGRKTFMLKLFNETSQTNI